MNHRATCGYCDETHDFFTAEQRLQWLDYHWADTGHDPQNAFLMDVPEPSTADSTGHDTDQAGSVRARSSQRPARRDSGDRVAAIAEESLRRQREGKQ